MLLLYDWSFSFFCDCSAVLESDIEGVWRWGKREGGGKGRWGMREGRRQREKRRDSGWLERLRVVVGWQVTVVVGLKEVDKGRKEFSNNCFLKNRLFSGTSIYPQNTDFMLKST